LRSPEAPVKVKVTLPPLLTPTGAIEPTNEIATM
jgi:hypothetical protein